MIRFLHNKRGLSIAREINKEGKVDVSTTGLMAYIKREKLM